jgi:hypothetical protein
MIISKTVKVHTTNKNIAYYKNIYPLILSGDIVDVNVSDLSIGSKQKVEVCCDKCGDEKIMAIKDYFRITNSGSEKYYCYKCKTEKTKQTNVEKYGVENTFQTEFAKEKSKNTCLKKYGVEYYSKTEEHKNKVIKTNIERYGVDYPMQSDEFKSKIDFAHSQESVDKMIKTTRENYSKIFLDRANNIHNYKYDYSEVDFINVNTKVKIICPIHGMFTQRPKDHIHSKQGCPICRESKGETLVANILQSYNVGFDRQKKFPELKYKKILYYDFYLPEYNSCIEYDGEQHFRAIDNRGGDENFKKIKLRDNLKNEYCITNNIPLLRLSYINSDNDVKSKILIFLNCLYT